MVENKGIGESAEAIWRNLGELQPSAGKPVESEPAAEMSPVIEFDIGAFDSTIDPVPVSAGVKDLLAESGNAADAAVQLPLF